MSTTPNDEHLRALLAAYDARSELVRVDRPRDGLSSSVFFVTTTREDLVLKVYTDDVGRWKPRKEQALGAYLRSLGIPAPELHVADGSKRIVPFAYALAGRIPGEPYSRVFLALGEGENTRIYAALGDALGRLHATTFDRFGDVVPSADGLRVGPAHELDTGAPGQRLGPFATWREMHDEIVRSRLELMRGSAFADLIPPVEAFFARHGGLLDDRIVPRLLHMDLHRGNVLVAGGEVAGILDVEEALVGHNEEDLMRTELANVRGEPPAYARAFLQAYEAHVTLDEGYAARRAFYDVSRTLAWIRSLILHGDRHGQGRAAREHLTGMVGEG